MSYDWALLCSPSSPPLPSPSFLSGVSIGGAHAVARYLCRLVPGGATPLYGSTNLEKAEIDHWLEYSLTALTQHQNATPITTLEKLNSILAPRVYLVGYQMTLADHSSLRGTIALGRELHQ